ncbi:hypothetical protein FEM48_Zijuj06G0213000 [Ziziphus jujuba var. spinosa]|uniref:Uncharacterized protein n=1 Tax=Ziziphus jujuba var. spinosa TaxID=714518 RepID=A0A978VBP2_ZIZJJ|nr:hypothetical protein FEM48_Zijuj06G0213000 [Ziziphus jujuba var. spinosa]
MSTSSKSTTSCSEDDNELRRGPWTIEEDTLLIHYIAHHGEGRWNLLAKRSGLRRTGKSCSLSWLNYLKPDVKRSNLTLEEQLLILDLHGQQVHTYIYIYIYILINNHNFTYLGGRTMKSRTIGGQELRNKLSILRLTAKAQHCKTSLDSSESMNHNTLGKSYSNVNNGSSIDIYNDASLSASGMFENPAGDYHVEHNSWNDSDFLCSMWNMDELWQYRN